MKQVYLFILLQFSLQLYGQVPASVVLLDDFNRNDSVKVGVPAGSTYEYWLEHGELSSCYSAIRLKNNSFEISKNAADGSSCSNFLSNAKAANIEMTFKYPTVFANAGRKLEWYFNMQQDVADPTGFNSGQVGGAFVIGCNTSNPFGSPIGYAIVYGDATTDKIRLVCFNGSFNNAAFTEIVSVNPPANKTNHMSIRVTFDPCNSEWTLNMRDDGAAFADPVTLTATGAVSAINNTLTSINLPWIGGIWNHGANAGVIKYDNIYIPSTTGSPSVYTWNGSTGTNFQAAANWTPARTCLMASDRLEFNSSSPATSIITNIPTQTIGQLFVTGSRNVVLKDVENDAVSTLTLQGGASHDLHIESGSTLSLDVSSSSALDGMVVSLGSGVTASISGTFIFTNSTVSGSNPHRLLGVVTNAITVNSGGIIRAEYLYGNPFGNSGNASVVLFNSGSAYECLDGADPFGFAAPSSKVIFSRGSTYRHLSNTQPSLPGRTYANFEFNANVVITNGGDAKFWNVDTLTILGGALELIGAVNDQELNTNIRGDLRINAGALFNYDPVDSSGLTFNSTFAGQNIINNGTLMLGRELTVRLNSNFVVPQLTVQNDIQVAGQLLVSLGTLKLDGNIHILSDAVKTASVGKITGQVTYGTGRFVVERYLAPIRAWRLLSVPTKDQTINAAWQEGNAPLGNTNPGYGTIITSDIPGNGFDIYTPNGPSLKTYNILTNSWVGVSRTDTAIANKKGYMLMVRGDRSVTTGGATPTSTILRTTGKIFALGADAPPSSTVHIGRFESVGNPYASAISFNLVTRSGGVQNAYYLWDPKLTGLWGVGGYQFFQFNGSGYDVIPGGGSYTGTTGIIESGQAFIAICTSPAGIVGFTENCKVNSSRLVNRPVAVYDELRTNLYVHNKGQKILLDGVRSAFHNSFSDAVGDEDVLKLDQTEETISLFRDGSRMVSEKIKLNGNTDTVFYRMDRLKEQQYEISFVRHGINQNIFLCDKWLGTKVRLAGTDTSSVAFIVTSDPASAAPDRFCVVFEHGNPAATGNLISIHPNPVQHRNFAVSVNDLNEDFLLSVLDNGGQVVYSKQFKFSSTAERVSVTLPQSARPGTYNVQVLKKDGTTLSAKIVVL